MYLPTPAVTAVCYGIGSSTSVELTHGNTDTVDIL